MALPRTDSRSPRPYLQHGPIPTRFGKYGKQCLGLRCYYISLHISPTTRKFSLPISDSKSSRPYLAHNLTESFSNFVMVDGPLVEGCAKSQHGGEGDIPNFQWLAPNWSLLKLSDGGWSPGGGLCKVTTSGRECKLWCLMLALDGVSLRFCFIRYKLTSLNISFFYRYNDVPLMK